MDATPHNQEVAVARNTRLTKLQRDTLEANFDELNGRIDGKKREELAEGLGLTQKQIDVWFQNRRSRGKYKRMEQEIKEYKATILHLKASNHVLSIQNDHLQRELIHLKGMESSSFVAPTATVTAAITEPSVNVDDLMGSILSAYPNIWNP